MLRELEFLAPASVTLLTERRRHSPWGLAGGAAGAPGMNLLNQQALPGKVHFDAKPGDVLTLQSAAGGGYGKDNPGVTSGP